MAVGSLSLRTGIVLAVTAIVAAGLFGAGVILGTKLDDSNSKTPSSYQVDYSASGTTVGAERNVPGDSSAGKPTRQRRASRLRERSRPRSTDPTIAIEERLNRSVLVARETYLDQAAVTRYQKALKNEVAYGSCKPASSGRYRCTVVELEPAVDPREEKEACLRSAVNRSQRRQCAHLPAHSRTQSTIDFDVSLDPNGCWVAVRPGKIDPTGSAKLEGCLSRS
jgi:hypothetical protein